MNLYYRDWKLPVLIRHHGELGVWLTSDKTEKSNLPPIENGTVSLLFEAEIETGTSHKGNVRVMFLTQTGRIVGRHITASISDISRWFAPVEPQNVEGR